MHITNLFKLVAAGVATGLICATVACSVSPEMDADMERRAKDVLDLKKKASVPGTPVPDDVVRVKNDIWLGDVSTIEFEGEAVPSYLETDDGITLVSNRPITLYEIGNMINQITSIYVRYAPELEDEAKSSADSNEPSTDSLGAQWTESSKMIVNYKGSLSGLLDEVSNRFGVWWKYEKNEIYFYKYVTKSFVIYSLPTSPDLSISVGGGGEGATSSISQSNSVSGLDVWADIESTINNMTNDAKLVMNKSDGTITLTATPTDIKRVAKYINEQNRRLSRQVAISVKVLQVNITNSDAYSAALNVMLNDGQSIGKIKDITYGTASSVDNPITNMSMGITSKKWSITDAISAFSTAGQTNLVTSGTVTTMNNKPAPIQVVTTENYVSNVTKTSSGDSGVYDISVDTDQIETGFTMGVLPRILDHGRILMFFNLTLSELLSLNSVTTSGSDDNSSSSDDEESGSSESETQLIKNPKIENRGFTQEVAMKSGDTLILAGFERVKDVTEKEGLGSPENTILGGKSQATKERSLLVIMLTPVVLESPLSPESRMN